MYIFMFLIVFAPFIVGLTIDPPQKEQQPTQCEQEQPDCLQPASKEEPGSMTTKEQRQP